MKKLSCKIFGHKQAGWIIVRSTPNYDYLLRKCSRCAETYGELYEWDRKSECTILTLRPAIYNDIAKCIEARGE